MNENDLQKLLACKFSSMNYGRLWVNDNGLGFRKTGQGFKYGLGPGSSDLIGFTLIEGKPIFTAFEVKMPKGYATKEQKSYIRMVQEQGGIAGIVRNWEDIEELIKKPTN